MQAWLPGSLLRGNKLWNLLNVYKNIMINT